MHVVARQAVGRGDEHVVDLVVLHGVAQVIEPWARQHGATVAIVAEHMGRVEHPALGRVRTQRYGPRTIDLDLLLYGNLVVDEPDLKVPHPELTRRSFVLVPLVELDPLLVHPETGETLVTHLASLNNTRPPVKRGNRLWN